MYNAYQTFWESVPFPKEGFQKYDVVIPVDKRICEFQFIVTDYKKCTKDPTRDCPYYMYELVGDGFMDTKIVSPEDLSTKYKFLYSRRSICITKDLLYLEEKTDELIEEVKSLDQEYKFNTKYILDTLEQVKLQIKHLE